MGQRQISGDVVEATYQVNIGSAVVSGANHIEIKAVNLWVNRLIGDVQPEVTHKYTFTFVNGRPIPGGVARPGRPVTMPYKPDIPLRASGLLGPVKIEREVAVR
jgi:hypothetical protein